MSTKCDACGGTSDAFYQSRQNGEDTVCRACHAKECEVIPTAEELYLLCQDVERKNKQLLDAQRRLDSASFDLKIAKHEKHLAAQKLVDKLSDKLTPSLVRPEAPRPTTDKNPE